MKAFFPLLLLCSLSMAAFSQSPGRQINEPAYYQQEDSESLRLAGEYLKKHSRQFYIGTGLMVAGYTVTYISLSSALNNQSTNGNTASIGAGITFGSLMVIGGTVIQILSHRHIGKAGEMLERSTLSHNLRLQGSPAGLGLGLAYRF